MIADRLDVSILAPPSTGGATLWARVQGARGGKKRTLTSEQARAMAAKRHGKK